MPRVLTVCSVAIVVLICAVAAFAQTPRAFEFNFEPVLPFEAIPPMPPMPPMPELPAEFFSFPFSAAMQKANADPQVTLQQEVFRSLLTNSPERAIEIATDRLKTDPGDPVILFNLSAIGASESPKAMPLLVNIAKSSTNMDARRNAIMAIVRSRNDKNALGTLEDIYNSNSDSVELRRAIVSSMGRLSDPRTVSVLTRIARSDADVSVKRVAIQILGNRKEPEANKALEDLLKDAPRRGPRN